MGPWLVVLVGGFAVPVARRVIPCHYWVMANNAVPLRDMYRLTNPDPLNLYTIRSLAELAGCSFSTIHRLRTGRLTEVSEPIARSIAEAAGVDLDTIFEPSGRVAWH